MPASPSLHQRANRERSVIRKSTAADLKAIHSWLLEEKTQGVDGNFLCNWFVIERSHESGRLLVYVDGASGVPVAFQLGDLLSPGILQVRNDMRRRGIGAKLVARRITEAQRNDECFLLIQCKPSSSVPFWRAMGFTLFERGYERYGYRILPKKEQPPEGGRMVRAEVHFTTGDRKRDKIIAPHNTTMSAVMTPDGVVHLGERVSCFRTLYSGTPEPWVEIKVNGQRRYCGNAKYPEAKRIGVHECTNGCYIDSIHPLHVTGEPGMLHPVPAP